MAQLPFLTTYNNSEVYVNNFATIVPSFSLAATTITAATYTIDDQYCIINADVTLNSIVITLETITRFPNQVLYIRCVDTTSTGNTVTILPQTAYTIFTASSYVLTRNQQLVSIFRDPTALNWATLENGFDQLAPAAPVKGTMLVSDGTNFNAFTPGFDGFVLTANSAAPLGLTWSAGGGGGSAPMAITISGVQINVGTTSSVIGYMPWVNSLYAGFTTRTVVAWVVPSSSAGKDVTIRVLPNGGASIGSTTITGGSAVGALYSFTFSLPGGNTRLDFTVSRTGGILNDPVIFGINVLLTP